MRQRHAFPPVRNRDPPHGTAPSSFKPAFSTARPPALCGSGGPRPWTARGKRSLPGRSCSAVPDAMGHRPTRCPADLGPIQGGLTCPTEHGPIRGPADVGACSATPPSPTNIARFNRGGARPDRGRSAGGGAEAAGRELRVKFPDLVVEMPDAATDGTKRDHGGAHLIDVLGHHAQPQAAAYEGLRPEPVAPDASVGRSRPPVHRAR